MARRGRKPKPTPLKILAGERADRLPIAGPAPAVVAPDCPAYLDADARGEWGRITAILADRGTLGPADGPALTLYCQAFSRWMRARAESGEVVGETAAGNAKANPACAVEAQAEGAMLRILESFGLTPAAAARVPARVEGPRDEFAELMARRKKG